MWDGGVFSGVSARLSQGSVFEDGVGAAETGIGISNTGGNRLGGEAV
jgi:hypothetical protein